MMLARHNGSCVRASVRHACVRCQSPWPPWSPRCRSRSIRESFSRRLTTRRHHRRSRDTGSSERARERRRSKNRLPSCVQLRHTARNSRAGQRCAALCCAARVHLHARSLAMVKVVFNDNEYHNNVDANWRLFSTDAGL